MNLAGSVVGITLCGLLFAVGPTLGARLPRQLGAEQTCGYESCPKISLDKLNIHMVAHTHDDVGWLKTVDQYYFGGRMNIQVAGVEYIIDSVIDALLHDRSRKFIYVETAFLWKWWTHQGEERKETVKNLINEGRLEIIGGAWSMNDEAVTHYHSIIDQFTWGLRRLNDTFGSCGRPKIGWQIDPFGHSREQASIFAQMGFDGLLFGRLDYQDKTNRLRTKTGEFIWEGSPNLGHSSDLFTSVLYNGYSPPAGFCFDILCQDTEPMIDDLDSPDYNIDRRVESFLFYVGQQAQFYRTNNVILTMGGDFTYLYADMYFKSMDKLIRYIKDVESFLKFAKSQASAYKTNNIILTMGEDFNYQYAEMWYSNLDKLIRYINLRNGTGFNAFYSTPSCYLKAVNEHNLSWTTKTDDFFPYASDPYALWTGYFSSRPTLKFFERMGNNFLQIVKQLSVVANNPDNKELQLFREAMGVMQHHDAVTGTEKQHVAQDYARILHHSISNGEKIASEALQKLLSKKDNPQPANFQACLLLNISSCSHTFDNNKFVVTIYNPTSQPITTFVRLPVQEQYYSVQDFTGKEIVTQIVPIPKSVQNIPGRSSKALLELIFQAVNVSALGYQSFYVSQKQNESSNFSSDSLKSNDQTMGGEFYNIKVNSEGKILIKSLKEENGLSFEQSFHYYEGADGNNNGFSSRSSGAYIFRPKQNITKQLPALGTYQIFKGPLVEEIHIEINEWVSEVIRIYKEKTYVEFDWLVGPIPIGDKIGKEVITKYSSNLQNNGEFFTDSNGREMIKRKLNFRPTWNLHIFETIAANYYPVTSKISMQDLNKKLLFSVLTDRAQGGSSILDGEIELMLHRRLLHDDGFGVNEALNEFAYGEGLVVRGQHYVVGGKLLDIDNLILQEKELANELSLRPWIFVTPVSQSFEEWSEFYKMQGETLKKTLPKNIRILTLEPWKEGEVLLRLEHFFEKGEGRKYNSPVDVDIKELLSDFTVHSVRETTLAGNQWIQDLQRLKWHSQTNEVLKTDDESIHNKLTDSDKIIISLKPMQIRTFVVNLLHGVAG